MDTLQPKTPRSVLGLSHYMASTNNGNERDSNKREGRSIKPENRREAKEEEKISLVYLKE